MYSELRLGLSGWKSLQNHGIKQCITVLLIIKAVLILVILSLNILLKYMTFTQLLLCGIL